MEVPPHIQLRCFAAAHGRMLACAMFARLPTMCRRIYCMHLHLSPLAAVLAWRLKCELDVFLHGVESWGGLAALHRHSLRRATSFSANSRYTLDRFHKTHSEFASVPSVVVPLGLNDEFTLSNPIEHPLTRKARRYFLTVTRFAETYKGERTLLDAFREVHAVYTDTHLICAGEGPTRQRIEEHVRLLGLSDAVHFVGHVSDAELAGLYAHALGFVLLSEGEGFGIVFLEAMHHAKPCIATNADAVHELVKDGETGLLVSPGDVAGTACAMRRLLEESSFGEKLGAEGRRRVAADYMPKHFQARLRAHFDYRI